MIAALTDNLTGVIVGAFSLLAMIYTASQSRKANKETLTITGFKELTASMEKRLSGQDEEIEKQDKKIEELNVKVDRLERREQLHIRWARQVITWYHAVVPHLEGREIPTFPPAPTGIEDTDPKYAAQ